MSSAEDADLMAIGQHCAHPDCQQLDFLPFTCDCCGKVFCLEHRTYAAHACPSAGSREMQVLVCPLCARAVKLQPGDDANAAFDRHCRTECDPANYDRVHRKKKCPVAGCKEKLTSINTYTCKDCGATVCLKHRLQSDHKCPGRAATASAAAQSRFPSIPQAFKGLFSGGGGSSSAAAAAAAAGGRTGAKPAGAPATGSAPSAGARRGGAAAARRQAAGSGAVAAQLQEYRSQHQQRAAGGRPAAAPAGVRGGAAETIDLTRSPATAPGGGGSGPEVCPQCSARFATVQQLIEHAEAAHTDGWSSGRMAAEQRQQQQQQRGAGGGGGGGAHGGLERCPHCGRQFADPVALVAHVERDHAGSSREGCVLC